MLDAWLELHPQISSVYLFASVTARRWSVFYRVSLILSAHLRNTMRKSDCATLRSRSYQQMKVFGMLSLTISNYSYVGLWVLFHNSIKPWQRKECIFCSVEYNMWCSAFSWEETQQAADGGTAESNSCTHQYLSLKKAFLQDGPKMPKMGLFCFISSTCCMNLGSETPTN